MEEVYDIQTESLNLDVDEVISHGVCVFLSECQRKFGDLREMEISYQGNRICRFEDGKGRYGEYLKLLLKLTKNPKD